MFLWEATWLSCKYIVVFNHSPEIRVTVCTKTGQGEHPRKSHALVENSVINIKEWFILHFSSILH